MLVLQVHCLELNPNVYFPSKLFTYKFEYFGWNSVELIICLVGKGIPEGGYYQSSAV